MSKASELRLDIHDLENRIKLLKTDLADAKKDELFACSRCKKRTVVKNISVVKEHYYIEPYSWGGGDYWRFSNYLTLCTKCNSFTNVYDKHGPTYNSFGLKDVDNSAFLFVKDHIGQFLELLDYHPNRRTGQSMSLEDLRKQKKLESYY